MIRVSVLTILAIAVLAGCGGDDEPAERPSNGGASAERFVNDFPPLGERISALRADVRKRIARAGRRPPQRLARNLGNTADELAELRQDVESMPTPATLVPQREVVAEAIRDVRRAVERMAAVASANRLPPALRNARVAVAEASRELGRARGTLAEAMRAAEASG